MLRRLPRPAPQTAALWLALSCAGQESPAGEASVRHKTSATVSSPQSADAGSETGRRELDVPAEPEEPKRSQTPGPLLDWERELLLRPGGDPPADKRLGLAPAHEGAHYMAGNEQNLHVYREALEGLGGAYVGVGSDQAYMFIGWQKPEVAWLIDYDPAVVDIHSAYAAFFHEAEDPETFRAMWNKGTRKSSLAIIEGHVDPETYARVRPLYIRYRGWIDRRLDGQTRKHRKKKVRSYLTDQEIYTWVRQAVMHGRVRPVSANLLVDGTIAEIGEAARDLGIPIRMLYLSNAQQYWTGYSKIFRNNIGSLHFDEHSLVVHTVLHWATIREYQYVAQPAENYLDWLERDWLRSVNDMVTKFKKPAKGESPVFELEITEIAPDESAAARRAQARRPSKD